MKKVANKIIMNKIDDIDQKYIKKNNNSKQSPHMLTKKSLAFAWEEGKHRKYHLFYTGIVTCHLKGVSFNQNIMPFNGISYNQSMKTINYLR